MSAVTEAAMNTHARLDLNSVTVDPKWALKIPASFANRKYLLPLCQLAGTVTVACLREPDSQTKSAVQRYLGTEIQWIFAEERALQSALNRVYQQQSMCSVEELRQKAKGLRDEADDAVQLCEELFQAALLRAASDIHLIPDERQLTVHLRVD